MPKFKVWDRVKLSIPEGKTPRYGFGPYVKNGALGVISRYQGNEPWIDFPKHKGWIGLDSELVLAPSKTTTKKPKETKMAKKPSTKQKSKYPKPREAIGILIPNYENPKCRATKTELVDQILNLFDTATEAREDLAVTGTKLDRALVDLKLARKRIKELEAAK